MKLISWDFEYNHSKDEIMNVVSVAYIKDYKKTSIWLHKDEEAKRELVENVKKWCDQGYVFLAHNFQAEARAILSCGLERSFRGFKAIDNFLEYRCLTNHNDRLMWGVQLIDGKVRRTYRPKYGKKKVDNSKPQHSLAATTYKLLDMHIDTDHKNMVRDLIISAPDEFTEEQKQLILCNFITVPTGPLLIHYRSNTSL